jgi:ABC-2 type transport system ATP-binding protein
MTVPAIETSGLTRSFGDHVVLAGVDPHIPQGTVYACSARTGQASPPSCTSSTLLRPDAGRARIAGRDLLADPNGVRAAIGLTGQFTAVDELLTAEENLLMARLRHLRRPRERAAELLRRFDLVDAARKPVSTFSGGMRRRLDLALGGYLWSRHLYDHRIA